MDALDITLRIVAVLLAFLVLPLLVGQTEHKVMAHMQGRVGPMYAGGFHGWAQLVADGVKFAQKEDIVPEGADRRVFQLAPALALLPYLLVLVAIPVAPDGGVVAGPGRGDLLRPRRHGRRHPRLAHGRLGLGQQVLPPRWPAYRGSAPGVRAAHAACRRLCRHGGGHPLPPGDPGCLGVVVAAVAADRRRRLLHGRSRRAATPALRHAGGRLGDHLRRVHRVHGSAFRALPARRVRGHRRALRAHRRALPRRLARPSPPEASAGCGRC